MKNDKKSNHNKTGRQQIGCLPVSSHNGFFDFLRCTLPFACQNLGYGFMAGAALVFLAQSSPLIFSGSVFLCYRINWLLE
ncbi:hypothetical protein HMPREF1141_2951 [Clostridium sp. MSTE9]|nr:hypothetical protein HMPREF1141_2951 [Clostridium sp. MSTE9]